MTHEERHRLHSELDHYTKQTLERVYKYVAEHPKMTLCELGEIVDIMKDVSQVHVNVAMMEHYSSEAKDALL